LSKSHKELVDLWKINAPYNPVNLIYGNDPFYDHSLIVHLIIWCTPYVCKIKYSYNNTHSNKSAHYTYLVETSNDINTFVAGVQIYRT